MKKLRSVFRNKKALSPVISTILMIMVVMVGMSVVFSSVVFYADSYRAGAGSAVLESLAIEDTWLHTNSTGSGVVDLWIYNVGNIPVNVKVIYVNGAALDVTSYTSFTASRPVNSGDVPYTCISNINCPIPVDGHAHISAAYEWQQNVPIQFKIATERGSVFEQTYP